MTLVENDNVTPLKQQGLTQRFKFAPGESVLFGPDLQGMVEEGAIRLGRYEPVYVVSWWLDGSQLRSDFCEQELRHARTA